MVSVEVTDINPSMSVITVSLVMFILPPAVRDQVIEGSGTPLAVQVKLAMVPSSAITVMLVTGLMKLKGSEKIGMHALDILSLINFSSYLVQ